MLLDLNISTTYVIRYFRFVLSFKQKRYIIGAITCFDIELISPSMFKESTSLSPWHISRFSLSYFSHLFKNSFTVQQCLISHSRTKVD